MPENHNCYIHFAQYVETLPSDANMLGVADKMGGWVGKADLEQ